MKKSEINFIIDAFMFLLMSLLIGLGLLIKYILLPNKEVWLVYQQNVELTFLGLDRHQWGTIHLIIALILIALLIFHIILHWKQIVCIYKRMLLNRGLRIVLTISFVGISAVLILFSFLIMVETSEHKPLRKYQNQQDHYEKTIIGKDSDTIVDQTKKKNEEKDNADHEAKYKNRNIDIKGYMTLNEVSDKYNVPVEHLKSELNIPDKERGDTRLAQLKRKYAFTMSDVINIIDEY